MTTTSIPAGEPDELHASNIERQEAHASAAERHPLASPPAARTRLMSLSRIADHLAADHRFGSHAPAHITLKRWSSSGVLEGARRPDPASPLRRSLYDLDEVTRIVLDRMGQRFTHHQADAQENHPGGHASAAAPLGAMHQAPADGGSLSQILSLLQDIQQAQQRQEAPPQAAAVDIDPVVARLAAVISSALNSHQAAMLTAVERIESRLTAMEVALKAAVELGRAAESLEATRKSLMARYDGELTAVRQRLADATAPAALMSGLEHQIALLQRTLVRATEAMGRLPAELGGDPAEPVTSDRPTPRASS